MLEAMQSSWETYTKCDPRPDAASERALNTFLSQGADEEASNMLSAAAAAADGGKTGRSGGRQVVPVNIDVISSGYCLVSVSILPPHQSARTSNNR